VLALAFVVAPFIYLVGDLRAAMGAFAYNVADFLYGPAWAASLVTLIFALREQLGERAPRRMTLALMAAALAAAAMLAVACIRSANRTYHLMHPELHLETVTDVLVVWTTLVAGYRRGWHLLIGRFCRRLRLDPGLLLGLARCTWRAGRCLLSMFNTRLAGCFRGRQHRGDLAGG
jgi:hypothetical protein